MACNKDMKLRREFPHHVGQALH